MNKTYKKIILIVLPILFFVPFYPVIVVPKWELQFFDKKGKPIPSIRVSQSWKDYSLEWGAGTHMDMEIRGDSNGYVKLPPRTIRASIFQIVSAPIFDVIRSINPHASFGSDSFLVCQGKEHSCVVTYKEKVEQPQKITID